MCAYAFHYFNYQSWKWWQQTNKKYLKIPPLIISSLPPLKKLCVFVSIYYLYLRAKYILTRRRIIFFLLQNIPVTRVCDGY